MTDVSTLAELAGLDEEQLTRVSALAWDLYRKQQVSDARALFRGLATVAPDHPDHYRGYALSSVADGDYGAAVEATDRALILLDVAEAPAEARAEFLALKAIALVRARLLEDALAPAQEALAKGRGAAAWRDELQKIVAELSGTADVGTRVKGGSKRLKRKMLEKARARRQNAGSVEDPELEALLAERLADVARGERSYAWALGYSDSELLELARTGQQLLAAGELARARRVFQGLVGLDSGVPLFHLGLGSVCQLLGDFPAARKAFDVAVVCARGVREGADLLAGALVQRGLYLAGQQKRKAARKDLEEALELPGLTGPDRDAATETLDALAATMARKDKPKASSKKSKVGAGKKASRAPPKR